MRKLYLCCAAVLWGITAEAQNAQVKIYTAPLAGTVVLSEVEDKYNAQVFNLESPSPDANEERKKLYAVKDEVHKLFPYKRTTAANKTTANVTPPTVLMSFIADSFSGIPPDNDMAISRDKKAVSVMNSNIAVSDGGTGQMLYRKGLKTFSVTVGLNNIVDNRYDPKVIYDPEADKFICVMLNATNEANYIIVAFSKTNDPAGQWNFYKFYGNYSSDTTWFDYPSIAITKNEFFLTGNKIKFNTSWQAGFTQSVIYQIDKQSGYNGDANITYKLWDGINNGPVKIRNLYPVKNADGKGGPAQYFLSNRNFDVQNDTIFLVKIPDVISSGNNNLTVQILQSPLKYGVPPEGRQPDTSVTLATNDGRILGAYAVDDEIQFVSACVAPVSGASGIFHGQILNYKTAPTFGNTKIFTIDTLDFGYPNISFVGNPWGLNQSLISFNYTGPNMYPGMGAILFNGVDYSPIVQVKTGLGSINRLSGKSQRWGDYMGSQPDYNDYGTVWIEGIYGRADNNYGNWMAKLGSPLLGVKKTQTIEKPTIVYPNPAMYYVHFEFELDEPQIVSFVIYDYLGRAVDEILEKRCKAGQNTIQFNIASLPSGEYFIKAKGEDGFKVMKRKFIKE
ncbi:MAG: T9SS type A sorting domain-containing protein [Bacteroidetes bacterium]|nr:T9SS type A sorting domain-containing protein [Bacteroidota bacterium]